MKNFLFALRRTAYVAGALAHAQLACFHGLHSKRVFLGGGGGLRGLIKAGVCFGL
jgi:hypothetical protein